MLIPPRDGHDLRVREEVDNEEEGYEGEEEAPDQDRSFQTRFGQR